MTNVHIFSDASVLERRGGIGFIILTPTAYIIGRDHYANCDVSCLEVLAVCKAMEQLSHCCKVNIYSDSKCVLEGWMKPKRPNRQVYKFYPLLQRYIYIHEVTFHKVGKGNPNPLHRRAHNFAREAAANRVTLIEVHDGKVRDEAERLLCCKVR